MDIAPAWDNLAREALEANPFYESWALIPAFEQFKSIYPQACLLLIWADPAHSKLLGLFPINYETAYHRCPAHHYLNWLHLHCPVGTPLVQRTQAHAVIRCFLNWVNAQSEATVFSFKSIPAEGAFAQELNEILRQEHNYLDKTDTWERAFLDSPLSSQEYFKTHLRKKRQKEFVRLRRRLAESGELRFEYLLPNNAKHVDKWINEFLQLEQAGWKGKKHTAFLSKPAERMFAENMMRNAAQRNQLMMLKMSLNGRAVAMKLNFLSSTAGAYALKIAYDEQYASYSPGVLLELENMRVSLDDPTIPWMDSCAQANHPMIDHLWAQRQRMMNLNISTNHMLSKPLIHTMRLIRSAYRHYKGG